MVLGSRLADYWGAADLSVEELIAWDSTGAGPIPIPLIVARGDQTHGFFGTAFATNGHIVQQAPYPPNPFTLVF